MTIPQHKNRIRTLAAALAGAAAGVAVFFWLYGAMTLDVTSDAWILNGYDETDILQHYAGWVLFRNSHWALPPGLCDTLAWPQGTMIAYTDSLPWVSMAFKLLRGALPSTFQWFGWYTLFCFAMQGAAGALLCTRGAKSGGWGSRLAFAALGGLLFACLPTLWERAFRHVALASQYLFLFALYFYLEYRAALAQGRRPRWGWGFVALPFAAVGIHPYFLPPVMLCTLLAGIELWRTAKRPLAGAGLFGGGLLAALAGAWLTGAVGSGVAVSRYGYGEISMNLNALFNPSSRGGYTWSRLLPQQAQNPSQYDGFNYLGLGVLALVASALLYSIWRTARRPADTAAWWRRNGPLFAACAFLTLFAVTNNITFGSWTLSIPIPQALTDLCGIFRSSGRMFYLVAACMVLFGVYTLRGACAWSHPAAGRSRALACGLLAVVCAVQLWDLSAAAAQKRALFDQEPAPNVVTAAETRTLGAGHTCLLAASPLREDRTRRLAILAGKQGLATNISIAVSGEYPAAEALARQAGEQLLAGQYDPETVYVTTDGAQYEQWQSIYAGDPNVTLFVTDSCYFLVPQAAG